MWVASLTVYYLAPIGRAGRVREGLWLVIGLLLVGVLVFRRTRQILAADFPGLRAVEGLAVMFVTHPSLGERVQRLRALDPDWRGKQEAA